MDLLTNLADVPATQPLPGFFARRVEGEQLSVQEVTLAAGEGSDFTHAHAHEQMLVMLSGRMTTIVGENDDERQVELRAGDVLRLPPGKRHGGIFAKEDSRFLDVFGPVPK